MLNSQDYYELIKKLLDQQYGDPPEVASSYSAWIPGDSEVKKKLSIKAGKTIDLTNTKKDKIKELIANFGGIIIGDFLIKIKKCSYVTEKSELKFDIFIYEENFKTHNGISCKMLNKIDVIKDSRFSQCAWSTYFTSFKSGNNIPEDTMVDIVRWTQAVHRMVAFI